MSKQVASPRGFFPGSRPGGKVVPFQPPTRAVVALSPGMRMRELLSRIDAKVLVRRSSPQDLFLLIRQVGLDDAQELLELCSLDHVQRMLDLDVWAQSEPQLDTYGEWLRVLLEVYKEKPEALLRELDPELLLLFLLDHIRVHLKDEEMTEEARLHLENKDLVETSDHQYLVEFLSAEDEWQDFILMLIDRVYSTSIRNGHWLMSALIWETPSMMEEQALRIRQGRLEELGFPTLEEALQIFQPLRSPVPFPRARAGQTASGPLREVPLSLEIFQPQDGSLLTRALEILAQRHPGEDLTHDLLHLANKMIVAEKRDPGELDDIRLALAQVHAGVNLGLEAESRGGLEEAVRLLRSVHLDWLFRQGHARVLELQRRARGVSQRLKGSLRRPFEVQPEGLWARWVEGLLLLRPKRYTGKESENQRFEMFSTVEQLSEARLRLDQLDIQRRFVFERLAPGAFEPGRLRRALVDMNQELTLIHVLMTSVVRGFVGLSFAPEPLTAEELRLALTRIFEPVATPGMLRKCVPAFVAQLDEAVLLWHTQPLEEDVGGQVGGEAVELLVRRGLELLELAYGALDPAELPELRFVEGPLLVGVR
ncbi:MAG: DUF6178 family protein [Myxococcota bacterium]